MKRHLPENQAGFTLIEVLISLALFSVMALAGIAMIESILRVEEQTKGRLDRIGAMQRAMYLLTKEIEQAEPGSFTETERGIGFLRRAPSLFEPASPVAFLLDGDVLQRISTESSGRRKEERLLEGVSRLDTRFYYRGTGWSPTLLVKPETSPPIIRVAEEVPQPIAVALRMTIAQGTGTPAGELERIVEVATSGKAIQ